MNRWLHSLKNKELQVLLRQRGLPTSGVKSQLIERLEHVESSATHSTAVQTTSRRISEPTAAVKSPTAASSVTAAFVTTSAAASPATSSPKSTFSVANLQALLKEKNLAVTGSKKELAARYFSYLKKDELKQLLKLRELPIPGNKDELVARLMAHDRH